MKPIFRFVFFILLLSIQSFWAIANQRLALHEATIVLYKIPSQDLRRTAVVLQEEISKRSALQLKTSTTLSSKSTPQIVLLLEKTIGTLPNHYQALLKGISLKQEGYAVVAEKESVLIVGKDARGLLYGVGKFLRKATMQPKQLQVPSDLHIVTSPQAKVRGHQLGYRAKTNSYDAFTVAQYDQYIRDLALFGANSIEILPPRTDDKLSSVHMKLAPMQMVKEQSRIIDAYGLDVWMWYPNLEKTYRDVTTIEKELAEREEVFKQTLRIDQLFAPGGDPGHLYPDELFDWMEKVAKTLQKYHPNAKIWLSPQSFQPDKQWFDAFFERVNQQPSWLGGLVFGPWVKLTMPEIKAAMKVDLPIRNYPDISHMVACQYPIPFWDPVWAKTLGREPINPRPNDQKMFHNSLTPDVIGSISYSEGVSDDVNKFIWSDQDWNSETDVQETLEDYARLFFGASWTYHGAEAIESLEANLQGPVISNERIEATLQKWQHMEASNTPSLRGNFRFQMGLLRAYYDAYTKARLLRENGLEQEAIALLSSTIPITERIAKAKAVLAQTWQESIRADWKQKCLSLADTLHAMIGLQLTMEKHGAASGRGNFIDFIDYPLNDAPWLYTQLLQIEQLTSTKQQQEAIQTLLRRKDPGIGGQYYHLGMRDNWQHITHYADWKTDPGSLTSPRTAYTLGVQADEWSMDVPGVPVKVSTTPKEWYSQIEAIYGVPLQVTFTDYDPTQRYKLRIAYTGRFKSSFRLKANGHLIHDYMKTEGKPLYEFALPIAATEQGKLVLSWDCKEEERGVQVSEVWLLKRQQE